jgi:hypothetical protein
MIRNWFRAWGGIEADCAGFIKAIQESNKRISDLEALQRQNLNLHGELNAALQEMRQLREMVSDPKKIPLQTRNSRQFRALVEQEL